MAVPGSWFSVLGSGVGAASIRVGFVAVVLAEQQVLIVAPEREDDIERAALVLHALDPDIAAVPGHKLAAQVEPQPQALGAPLAAARIALEEARGLLIRD